MNATQIALRSRKMDEEMMWKKKNKKATTLLYDFHKATHGFRLHGQSRVLAFYIALRLFG